MNRAARGRLVTRQKHGHPKASIGEEVSIGVRTVVMAGASISPCSSVGRFCILNPNSSRDHDSVLEDFASLAPGATTGGNRRIGHYSAISIGAILVQGIHIGEHTVVGAGSLVMKPIESFVVAYGTPAKAVRDRKHGDKYLEQWPTAGLQGRHRTAGGHCLPDQFLIQQGSVADEVDDELDGAVGADD